MVLDNFNVCKRHTLRWVMQEVSFQENYRNFHEEISTCAHGCFIARLQGATHPVSALLLFKHTSRCSLCGFDYKECPCLCIIIITCMTVQQTLYLKLYTSAGCRHTAMSAHNTNTLPCYTQCCISIINLPACTDLLMGYHIK